MITWVLILGAGILIGIGVGLYMARLDDAAKRTQQSLNQQIEDKDREMAMFKEQVNSHFVTTADLVNNMTESYRAVHEHLAVGATSLCKDAANINSIPFEDKKMLTEEAATESDDQLAADKPVADDISTRSSVADESEQISATSEDIVDVLAEERVSEEILSATNAEDIDQANVVSDADSIAAEPVVSELEKSRVDASRMVH